MTKMYDNERFKNPQYLVFCNRAMALIILIPLHFLHIGLLVNPWKKGQKAPFIEFAYASVSNVISSWCQYEALIYISFPSQVSYSNTNLLSMKTSAILSSVLCFTFLFLWY